MAGKTTDRQAQPIGTGANMAATGERIRAAREARGLTMADLARSAGISAGAVSRIERGERAPGSVTLRRLAQALGVTPGNLMDEAGAAVAAGAETLAKAGYVAQAAAGAIGDGRVLQAISAITRVMPTLPEAGQARVLSVIIALLS